MCLTTLNPVGGAVACLVLVTKMGESMSEMMQRNAEYSGEISLIDLATIFVRRIWVFIATFVLVLAVGVAYALWAPEEFEYVSLYQIAETAPGEQVEPPAKAIAIISSSALPELEAEYKAANGDKLPFSISLANPDDTGLVRIASRAQRDHAGDVKEVHEGILREMGSRHALLLQNAKRNLELRIEAIKNSLDSLAGSEDAGRAIAEAIQKQVELEGELAQLTASETLVVTRESVDRVAPNRKLIVLLAFVLGFIIAILAVYFAEFACVVKRSMKAAG